MSRRSSVGARSDPQAIAGGPSDLQAYRWWPAVTRRPATDGPQLPTYLCWWPCSDPQVCSWLPAVTRRSVAGGLQ